MNLFPKKRLPAALLATHVPEVLASLPVGLFQTREAISTRGITSALYASPVLVIADLDDVIECDGISRAEMKTALETMKSDGVVVLSSRQFLKEQQRWVGEALMANGSRSGVRYMPGRVVMNTNYCGGVGKTTLSLALARRFRAISGLATAVVELGVGGSSLNARIGKHTSLYDIVTQDAGDGQWEKVSIFPADSWEAEVLAADDRTPAALRGIAASHTLTILDTFPTNPLWKYALELVTDVFVVTAPRPDALIQADAMLHRLDEEILALDPKPRVRLILNQVRSPGERLLLAGQISAWVGFNQRQADSLDGSLADPVLELLYPGWAKRSKKRGKGKGGQE